MTTSLPVSAAAHRLPAFFAWFVIVAALLLFPCGTIQYGDGKARLIQTKAFLQGSIAIPPNLLRDNTGQIDPNILQSPNGNYYSKYGLGISILWIIPVGAALAIHKVTGVNYDLLAHFFTSFFNPLITLLICVMISKLLRHDGRTRFGRIAALATLLLATTTLPMANTGFSEPLCALLILAGFTLPLVMANRGRAVLLSGALLASVATIKPDLAFLPALGLLIIARFGLRQFVRFSIAASWGALWILITNKLFRGGWLSLSYGAEAAKFQSPAAGLYGYFLGVDRNIVLFNLGLLPALLAWIWLPRDSRWRPLRLPVLALWLCFIALYAAWWEWRGGWCFGPRFFLPLIPLTLLPIGQAAERIAAATRGSGALRLALSVFVVPLFLAATLIEWSGTSVANWEAHKVVDELPPGGATELGAQLRLLELKLIRGPRSPERYQAHDFIPMIDPAQDKPIDLTERRQMVYLNHWWAIFAAMKMQGVSAGDGPATH